MTTTIRFGGYQGPQSVHTRAAQVFASAVESATAGDVKVELRANVTDDGHAAADLLTMVRDGQLDICYFSSSYLTEQVPALAAIDLPFHFANREAAYTMLDGPIGSRIADDVDRATKYNILGFWDNGFRHISNSVRPIRRAIDCQGLRLRTLNNAFHQSVFRALGFSPETIDVRDLVPAIKANRIDAQENPLTNIVNFGIHEFQPHITLTSHFFGSALLLCNQDCLRAWSADLSSVIRDAAQQATQSQRQFAEQDDASCLSHLHEAGIRPHIPSAEELESFQTAVDGLKSQQLEQLPAEISQLI